MNYKDAKYGLVIGRAIDGCGLTKCAVELQTWCNRNGVELEIFAYEGKKMSRHKAHVMDYVGYKEKDLDNLQESLNKKDVVIFFSYPYAKSDHSYVKSFYDKIIMGVNNPVKIGFIHEVHKTYIDKIPYMVGIMNNMDAIYGYGPTTWFNRAMNEMFPSKVKDNRVKRIPLWLDFETAVKYRNENPGKEHKIMYIGRWTSTKEPHRLLFLAPHIKKLDNDFKIVLRGIEKSRGAKDDIYDNPYCIDMTSEKKGPIVNEHGCAEVYKEYIHDEAMQEMSNTMFGCSFFHLDKHPEEYGDRMEYTMMEIIVNGAIPVFDVHWAKHNVMASTEKTFYDYNIEHPFMIVSDREKLEETAKEIIDISKNELKQKEMIDNGFNVIKMEFDADNICPSMLQDFIDVGKDKKKFKTNEDIIRHLIAPEYVDEYLKLYNEYKDDHIVVFGYREMYEKNIFSILDGNKEVEIKEFKKSRLKKNK